MQNAAFTIVAHENTNLKRKWNKKAKKYLITAQKSTNNQYAYPGLAGMFQLKKKFFLTPEDGPEEYYQLLFTSWPGPERSSMIISGISSGPGFGPVGITIFQ